MVREDSDGGADFWADARLRAGHRDASTARSCGSPDSAALSSRRAGRSVAAGEMSLQSVRGKIATRSIMVLLHLPDHVPHEGEEPDEEAGPAGKCGSQRVAA